MGQIQRITKYLFGDDPAWDGGDDGRQAGKNGQARIKNGVVVALPADEEPEDEREKIKPGRLPNDAHYWEAMDAKGWSKRTISEYHYELAWWVRQARARDKKLYAMKAADIVACLKAVHPSTARRYSLAESARQNSKSGPRCLRWPAQDPDHQRH